MMAAPTPTRVLRFAQRTTTQLLASSSRTTPTSSWSKSTCSSFLSTTSQCSAEATSSSPVASTSTSSAPSSTPSSFSSRSSPPGSTLYAPALESQLHHVEALLAPLHLPAPLDPRLCETALTHKSGQVKGRQVTPGTVHVGHGEKLAFLGRRILRLHYTLYLTSSLSPLSPALHDHLSQPQIDLRFDTKELGATAGKAWGLQDVIRWREVRGPNGELTGLFKARGQAVEALVGAVYTQFGIRSTEAMFQQLVLPRLGLSRGLKQALGLAGGSIGEQDAVSEQRRTTV